MLSSLVGFSQKRLTMMESSETMAIILPAIVLVKKSNRLLFTSFGFAVQSISGPFLFPASTVRPFFV